MPALTAPPIFDGHNDILSVLYQSSAYPDIAAFGRSMPGHLDLKKAETGGFAGGFFAIWVPSPIDGLAKQALMSQPSYDLPLPPAIDTGSALGIALAQAGLLLRLEAAGWLNICTSGLLELLTIAPLRFPGAFVAAWWSILIGAEYYFIP